MSIRGAKKKIKPKAWSKAAKDLIEDYGREQFAKDVGTGKTYLSSLHNGSLLTTPAMVERVATFALGQLGVCLTPADLGRPDLAKKGGEG